MRAVGVALLLVAVACAPRLGGDGTRTQSVTTDGATVRIEYQPEDAAAAEIVAQALEGAIPRAQRWGKLRTPVTITIHPTHEALEAAVRRDGYGWLRAWARYASIDLQSPRTWSLLFGPDERQVEELLSHELTHCAMYQLAGSEWSWQYKGIPLWFREGMASVTAGQAHRRSGPEPVWRFYARSAVVPGAGDGAAGGGGAHPASRPKGDPVTDPDPLYQSDADLVYGAAHLAFQFLLDRYGEDRIARLLEVMGEGHLFPSAFESAIGISSEAFEAEFRRYIAWHGWRG
jgi:hypothetical protein